MKKTPRLVRLLVGGTGLMLPVLALAQHPQLSTYTGYASCKGCHPGVETEIMQSLHWTWNQTDEFTGKDVGKINIINNYCVAVASNEPRCTSCHIGIGWADATFDHSNPDNIDCLVCHDKTGTYKKIPTGAGAPVEGLDYAAITSQLAPAEIGRDACGACHFYGGGGDAVKHGSLDSTMANPSRDLDVHMGGSFNMDCTTCHAREGHVFVGSRYSKSTTDNRMCQNCHGVQPSGHASLPAAHFDRVACQTCHIPEYARGGKATKMFWDWTTAGEKNGDGSDKVIKDADGNVIYDTKKGTFRWEANVVPEYVWFNGNLSYVTLDDTFAPGEVVPINVLEGDVNDPTAFIFPVKRFTGIQPYDAGAGTLAIPNLFPYPKETDNGAFWKSYDWTASLTTGMEAVGRTFTGPVGNIETEMFWIQNHMVAPKEQALGCADCHTFGSRMNFAALGYDETRAAQLQLMAQSEYWAGYPVTAGGYVDTDGWLGWIYIEFEPWIYVVSMNKYIYIQESSVTPGGAWAYLMK